MWYARVTCVAYEYPGRRWGETLDARRSTLDARRSTRRSTRAPPYPPASLQQRAPLRAPLPLAVPPRELEVLPPLHLLLAPLLRLAVRDDAHDRDGVPQHAHAADRVLEEQDAHHHRHRALGVAQHLQRQRRRALGHQKVGEVHAERQDAVEPEDEEKVRRLGAILQKNPERLGLHRARRRDQDAQRHRGHVQQEVERVQLLGVVGEQQTLQHRLERAAEGGADARDEPGEVERGLRPRRQDDAEDDREQGDVHLARLLLAHDEEREQRGEEGGGGADGLVEAHRDEAKGDVAADDARDEHHRQHSHLHEVAPRLESLPRGDAGGADREREREASDHVARGEEDGELETPHAEQVLVEQDHADVAEVPRRDHQHGVRAHARGSHLGLWGETAGEEQDHADVRRGMGRGGRARAFRRAEEKRRPGTRGGTTRVRSARSEGPGRRPVGGGA